MNRLNLFGKEWANIVFEGRNKSYGAYKLRRETDKTTLMSLAIGLGILSAVFGSSYLYASKTPERIILVSSPVIVDNIPVIKTGEDKKPEIPVPEETLKQKAGAKPQAATDVQKNIRYTEARVIEDGRASNDQLASQSDFTDDVQSGKSNLEADPESGKLKSDGAGSGTSKAGGNGSHDGVEGGKGTGTEDRNAGGNSIVRIVQHKAVPNEGYQKFYENFTRKFSVPGIEGNAREITVKLRFVVELDGSFSDIKVLDDSMGMGDEAIRVLKTMPKWKPAEHNGKTVRSVFTLPVRIRVN